jgi:hypothetical protein
MVIFLRCVFSLLSPLTGPHRVPVSFYHLPMRSRLCRLALPHEAIGFELLVRLRPSERRDANAGVGGEQSWRMSTRGASDVYIDSKGAGP